LIETDNVTEFDAHNRYVCMSLIGSWSRPDQVDEIYYGFLASILRQHTLTKFDRTRAGFDTYVSKCLKNYISVYTRQTMLDKLRSESSEDYDTAAFKPQDLSPDFKKDLYGFYQFYKGHTQSYQKPRIAQCELDVLKMLYKGLTPNEIAKSLNIQPSTIYMYRKKFSAFYKSFLKT